MELQELQELLQELLQGIQSVIESGEELSDELQGEIAKTLELLYNRIEQLSGNAPTQAPQVPSGPYPSSNVNGFKYNPETGELLVQFHGPYPQAEGSIYAYKNVPPFIYNVFSRGAIGPKTSGQNKYHRWIKGVTPSLGAAMNALIKAGGYSYTRVH